MNPLLYRRESLNRPTHGLGHSPVTPLPLFRSPTNPIPCPFFLFVPVLYCFLPSLQERHGPRLVQSKADPRSPQPGTQLLQPLIVTEIGYALLSKAIHPAFRISLSKGYQSCSWLEAVLKLHWCTSWDLCLAQRIWTGKP